MNPRTKNLVLAGGAVIAVGFVAINMLVVPPAPPETKVEPAPVVAGGSPATPSAPAPPDAAGVPAAAPSPTAPGTLVDGAAAAEAAERRSYAIGLQDLAGLPPDAAPGARLELWVTWEPPVAEEPQLQKLIGDVVLERTIPGSVPEAPVTVLLSVPADRVGDLIYADGYGRLSVVAPG
jgi:hypothetical protein